MPADGITKQAYRTTTMSENNDTLAPITLANNSFPLVVTVVQKRSRVDDPDKVGKKKTVEKPKSFFAPATDSVAALTALFAAVLAAADTTEAGNGVKLGRALVLPHLEEAFDHAYNSDTDDFSVDKYVNLLTSPERPRSAGQSLQNILEELGELAIELTVLGPKASSPDGWRDVAVNGKQVFASQQAFVLRLNELYVKTQALHNLKEAKAIDNEKKQAKRKEKEAAANAAAAKAAAPAPAPAV